MKSFWTLFIATLSVLTLVNPLQHETSEQKQNNDGIIIHYRGDYTNPHLHYWDIEPSGLYTPTSWPGEKLIKDSNDWYTKEFIGVTSIKLVFNNNRTPQTGDLSRTTGEWWYLGQGTGGKWYAQDPDTIEDINTEEIQKINLHVKSTLGVPKILYYDSLPTGTKVNTPTNMFSETNNWYRYGFHQITSIKVKITIGTTETKEYYLTNGEWYLKDGVLTSFKPNETPNGKNDFREETIYFLLTARFFDGDTSNNVHCWDDRQAQNPDTDPAWRGDFKGLIEKLDYIKALGFSAIWISPVVENASGYDYHGYHALDFSQIDPRLESPYATYQDLINEAHARDMKIIQDVVFNHTGNFGEKNIYPLFEKDYRKEDTVSNLIKTDPNNLLPSNYDTLNGGQQYSARIDAMKEDHNDSRHFYHHEKSLSWETYTEQTAQIAGDCVDLNTENPYVTNYLIDAYNRYIEMGVDGFRVDTVKHISRLVFDQEFNPAFKAKGGDDFFMFGEVATRVREVWNHGNPANSTPFYTWKETKTYPWATRLEREASVKQNWDDNNSVSNQPTSNNH